MKRVSARNRTEPTKASPAVYAYQGDFNGKTPRWLVVDADDKLVYCPEAKTARCESILTAAKLAWQRASRELVATKLSDGMLDHVAETPEPMQVGALRQDVVAALQSRHFPKPAAERMVNECLKDVLAKGIMVRRGNRLSINPEKGEELLNRHAWIRNCRLLLGNIKARMPELEVLRKEAVEGDLASDCFYRYYHSSFKVYWLQSLTERIVEKLKSLLPGRELNRDFTAILAKGTGVRWEMSHNREWHKHTGPILEACFHARTMLELSIRSGKRIKYPPTCLPTDWAAVLYLFRLR